jgi:hypothetical protein
MTRNRGRPTPLAADAASRAADAPSLGSLVRSSKEVKQCENYR